MEIERSWLELIPLVGIYFDGTQNPLQKTYLQNRINFLPSSLLENEKLMKNMRLKSP